MFNLLARFLRWLQRDADEAVYLTTETVEMLRKSLDPVEKDQEEEISVLIKTLARRCVEKGNPKDWMLLFYCINKLKRTVPYQW